MTILHYRKDYLLGNVTHKEYYGQFVDSAVIKCIESLKDRILNSTDERLNDIDLSEWDLRAFNIPASTLLAIKTANGTGISLSDRVCVLKAAARELQQQHKAS